MQQNSKGNRKWNGLEWNEMEWNGLEWNDLRTVSGINMYLYGGGAWKDVLRQAEIR